MQTAPHGTLRCSHLLVNIHRHHAHPLPPHSQCNRTLMHKPNPHAARSSTNALMPSNRSTCFTVLLRGLLHTCVGPGRGPGACRSREGARYRDLRRGARTGSQGDSRNCTKPSRNSEVLEPLKPSDTSKLQKEPQKFPATTILPESA